MIRDLKGRVRWSNVALYSTGGLFFAAVVVSAVLTLLAGWL